MDRWRIRSVEEFWGVVEAHRGRLALRDLNLRRSREPKLARVFAALRELGLLLRWPSPEAAIAELHTMMLSRGWGRAELAVMLDVSPRTAARLAARATPSLSVFLRWSVACDRGFFAEATRKEDTVAGQGNAAERIVDPRAVASTHATGSTKTATMSATSGLAPEHVGAEVAGLATSGRGLCAHTTRGTEAALREGRSAPPSARLVACSPEAAQHAGRSGPPSAHLSWRMPEVALMIGTSGQDQNFHPSTSGEPDPGTPPTAPPDPTCPMCHGTCGHELCAGSSGREATSCDPDEALAPLGRSGPMSAEQHVDASAEAVELSDPHQPVAAARKKALPDPLAAEQADPVMVTVEWKKDGEVVCTQSCPREELKETLRAMSRVPNLKGADPYVDGRRHRRKSRQRGADVAAIERVLAQGLRPLIEENRKLAERQAVIEHRQMSEQYLSENIENLQKLLAPTAGPSGLKCLIRAFFDELGGEGE